MQNLELSQWGLPEGVLDHYKKRGIFRMFPWQLECLSNGKVLEGENLVYSAPTSAGKTLVAEILVAQTIFDRHKKALFILPFVSVVREKMFYFQDMFSANGIRVEGYMGGHTPSASFQQVNVGVCTIEKANSLINRMLEEKTLPSLGIVVVDELHMLGDPYRGYLLELMLTKLLYMASVLKDLKLQIVGMSATLPNLHMLAKWLNAHLYYTDFRPIPLQEHLKCGKELFNSKLEKVQDIKLLEGDNGDDSEQVGQMCIETFKNGHSVLIFCPTKVWCESLSLKLATFFRKLGCSELAVKEGSSGWILRQQLDLNKINEVVNHLKMSAVGLDKDLAKTVSYGVAFHHAGLTLDERDIIEGSFRNGALRVVCATSTLSSGVNLPARRVIIRSPMAHGGVMDILTYRQMIGRAGRMGKDTEGESILICKPTEKQACRQLMAGTLKPIESCLGSGRLSASLKRAILEIVASGIASTPEEVARYAASTFLASSSRGDLRDPLTSCLDFLVESELIRLQAGGAYAPTPLGQACLASSLPPDEGLALFRELERARRCFVLDSDLHIIYQVTPYSVSEQWSKIDWLRVLNMLEELSPSMRRVADLVGVQDSFLVKVVKGSVNLSLPEQRSKLSIHRRFYTALALQDLVNEVPLPDVARKFDCSKGMLQSLQQSAATYAGMVSEFARRLRWGTIEVIVSQFHERLQFGVQKELCEIMRLSSLNGVRARTLFNAGFTTLSDIANSDIEALEAAFLAVTPFQTKMQIDGETGYEHQHRTRFNTVWVTGKTGLSIREAAEDLIKEARNLLELEFGVKAVWGKRLEDSSQIYDKAGQENSFKNSQIAEGIGKSFDAMGSTAADNVDRGKLSEKGVENKSVKEKHVETVDSNTDGCEVVGEMDKEVMGKIDFQKEGKILEEISEEPYIIELGEQSEACQRNSNGVEDVVVLKEIETSGRRHRNNVDEGKKSLIDTSKASSGGILPAVKVNGVIHSNKPVDCNTKGSVKIRDISECGASKDAPFGELLLTSVCDWDLTRMETFTKNENGSKRRCSDVKMANGHSFKVPKSDKSTPEVVTDGFKHSRLGDVTNTNLKNTFDKGKGNNALSDVLLSSVCEWDLPGITNSVGNEEKVKVNNIDNANEHKQLDGKGPNNEPVKPKDYPHDIEYFEATLNASSLQSPLNDRMGSNPRPVTVRSRFSTDLFEESPKPTSTPLTTPKQSAGNVNSPDLFSQSLTFDTQLEELYDTEDIVEDETNSPPKSNDQGFFSDTSPVIVPEVSVCECPSLNLDTSGVSVLVKETPLQNARKRKASPDVIAGSDDSTTEEGHISRKFMRRPRLKKRKEEVPLVTLDSSGDEDAEIAPTPQITRSLSLSSPKRKMEIARCLSLGSPRRGTHALLTRIKGLGYAGSSQKPESKTIEPKELVVLMDDVSNSQDKSQGVKPVQERFVANEGAKALSLLDVNWETLNFVDVCGNASVFKSFREELTKQQILGLAVGCRKMLKEKKTKIGANLVKNFDNEEENQKNIMLHDKFSFGELVLDGIAFYWNENNIFYMKMNAGIDSEDCLAVLRILKTMKKKIRIFDMKEQVKTLSLCTGVSVDGYFEDPKVASWLTSTTNQDLGLKGIIAGVLPQALKLTEVLGPGKETSSPALYVESSVDVKTRACVDAYLAYHLMTALKPALQNSGMQQLFYGIEMPTLQVLVEMEEAGFRFDEGRLKTAKSELDSHVTALEQKAHGLAGRRFALSSYLAVGKVIHNELRLGKGFLDPKKKHGTSKEVLELLSVQTKHPLPNIILQWRKLKAIITKVLFPLLQLLPQTRVYGSSQIFTITGRISMKEPNLQNIPRDFDVVLDTNGSVRSVRLRDIFIASEGTILLSADYCQVELRLLACLSKDAVLIQTIRESSDVFMDIAATISGVPKDQVTPEQRQLAKQTCYGIIYGIGIKALSQQLQVSEEAAQILHNEFKAKYEGVRQYLLQTVGDCQREGYVKTLAGRRRYLPAINSATVALRSEAERQAVNTTVQGSAADLVKTAMVKFREKCQSNTEIREKVRLVLHLHDELIYEVHEAALSTVASLLKDSMENAMPLPVPFPVKVRAGPSWGQLAPFSIH